MALEYLGLVKALRLKKARALVLFLMLSPGRAHRNEKIIDLLWRDSEAKKSEASFRQTVRHLRLVSKSIMALPLTTGNGRISIDLPQDWSLVADLTAGLEDNSKFAEASNLVRSFLDNLDLLLGMSDSFDSWVEVVRARALAHLSGSLENTLMRGELAEAYHVAEFLIEIEPYNEVATRFVMIHYWRNQSATRAIDVYNRLYIYLDDEFDQEPETETVELVAAIKLDPEGGSSVQTIPPVRQKVTLSIQGVEDTSIDKRDASFQAVLVSDLRMRLSRFREWQIIDALPQTGDFLTITLQLFSVGQKYRLVVEVAHPGQRELLWSELIDDPQTMWHDKVRLLVFNVANALRVVVADRHSSDHRAVLYDRWLRSLALKGTWTRPDEEEAVALLRGITKEAPNFGPAHAELAGIYNIRHILRPGTFQTENLKDMALNHALEAVAVDTVDTRAHRVLAWCYCHKLEFDLAEFHFDQSLMLNPQNAHTIASSALGFAFCGNFDRVQDQIEEVTRLPGVLEPFHQIYLAACNYLVGSYELTIQQCQSGKGLMSTVGGWHSAALMKLGRVEDARQRIQQYRGEIEAVWCGDHAATTRNVTDWFVSCFPLRDKGVRVDLLETLNQIHNPVGKLEGSVAHIGDVDTHRSVESSNGR